MFDLIAGGFPVSTPPLLNPFLLISCLIVVQLAVFVLPIMKDLETQTDHTSDNAGKYIQFYYIPPKFWLQRIGPKMAKGEPLLIVEERALHDSPILSAFLQVRYIRLWWILIYNLELESGSRWFLGARTRCRFAAFRSRISEDCSPESIYASYQLGRWIHPCQEGFKCNY